MEPNFYSALNIERLEIRLLTVQPGEQGSSLECTLQTVSLLATDRPRYETISYCWGDPTERASLLLDGQTFIINTQAVAALQAARQTTQPRTVWIDTICINQSDIEERGSQVAIMDRIYLSSIGNLIFLGNHDSDVARRTFANFPSICEAVEKFSRRDEEDKKPKDEESIVLDEEALRWLYSSPWYRRLWIVQECILAPRNSIIYEGLEIDFAIVLQMAPLVRQALKKSKTNWAVLIGTFIAGIFETFRRRCHRSTTGGVHSEMMGDSYCEEGNDSGRKPSRAIDVEPKYSLTDLLINFGGQECAQLHDKVYGMLGLLQPIENPPRVPAYLQPDYRKDPYRVLLEATRYQIFVENDMNIDMRVAKRSPVAQHLPSWATDWTELDLSQYHDLGENFVAEFKDRETYFTPILDGIGACGRGKLRILIDPGSGIDLNILSVEGVPIGSRVVHRGPTLQGLQDIWAYLKTIDRLDSPAPSDTDALREILEILTAGSHPAELTNTLDTPDNNTRSQVNDDRAQDPLVSHPGTRRDEPRATFGRKVIRKMALLLSQCVPSRSKSKWQTMIDAIFLQNLPDLHNAILEYCHCRCLFTTDDARLVLGPRTVEVGDELAILAGCALPVVLRPHGSQYLVIGPAYIQGIMRGEAVDAHLANGQAPEIYNLI